MNQRWKFTILSENKNYISVYIMSALTDMYIVINHDSKGLMQASYPE